MKTNNNETPQAAEPAGGFSRSTFHAPRPTLTGDTMSEETLQRTVRITNPQGLHMRPSVAFAELAGRYACRVTVYHEGRSVDGKSPWDLLLLAAMPGTELTVEAAGPDAGDALDALTELLARPPEEEPPVPPKG